MTILYESINSIEESFSVLGDACDGLAGYSPVSSLNTPNRAIQEHFRAVSLHQQASLKHVLNVFDRVFREHHKYAERSEEQLRLPI